VLGGYVCGHTDGAIAEPYFFAVKRSSVNPEANLLGYSIIDDICFIFESEGEEEPMDEAYIILDKCLLKKSQTSHKIYLGYHERRPQGLCDIKYESATLDRYPEKV
jgi:hypothetical protein